MVELSEDRVAAGDGTPLWRREWRPDGCERAAVLLVHGVGEHLGRYDRHARALADRGLRVRGVDLRGHGRSGGRRGHVRRWADYAADLDAAAAGLPEPFLLLAHSMGGLVALDWLRGRRPRVRALALSSPLLGVGVRAPGWKVVLGRALSRIAPGVHLPNELPPEGICSDPEVVRRYLEDPLVFRSITPRWFTEMERALARVRAAAPAGRQPLYLNLAGDERLVDNEAAEAFAEAWGGPVRRRRWPGLRHETLNEPQGGEVLAAIADWFEEQLAAT
ncbi:MAG: alpha/beta fold hydrolase [Planctomycetota bacterium]|nr:MAG: alpha/beta fold hydrolase [Planctomycetota bacterium]